MSGEMTPIRQSSTRLAPPAMRSIEGRILAVAAAVLLHCVLVGGGAVAAAIVAARGGLVFLPRQPLLVCLVALLLAYCSLGAIWWARSAWPTHLKTLIAVLLCTCLWALLVGRLDTVRVQPIAAACWAASIGTQVVLTGLVALMLESVVRRQPRAALTQFSILCLFAWTTLVAALLGGGRWLAQRWGWTIADMLDWQFWQQLQCVGLGNALLAIGLLFSVRLPHTWRGRAAACLLTICLVSAGAPLVMIGVFGTSSGPMLAELIWLWGLEGLFLVAALVPLEICREIEARVGGTSFWRPTSSAAAREGAR
jgi:hypothetical protein